MDAFGFLCFDTHSLFLFGAAQKGTLGDHVCVNPAPQRVGRARAGGDVMLFVLGGPDELIIPIFCITLSSPLFLGSRTLSFIDTQENINKRDKTPNHCYIHP